MSVPNRRRAKKVPIFAVLSDEELQLVAGEGAQKRVGRVELNVREGEPVEYFRITKKVDDGEMVINTYGPGTFFAEVPLLAGTPFVASGRALTDCQLFLFPEATFRRLLTFSAPFASIILETMAQRVQILQSVAQQREKLGSLNTLAAGLAHKLNNPVAVSRRATGRLREGFESLRALGTKLVRFAAEGSLGPAQLDALEEILADALRSAADPPRLASLEQSKREDEISTWLEEHGVGDGWGKAPTFAAARADTALLDAVHGVVPPGLLPDVLGYLEATLEATEALDEAEKGTARVSDLGGAVRSYSYLDRAPLVEVDVEEGLESTLFVLGYRLRSAEIAREYDPKLPRTMAYGGELNQVWTQLLENALDAIAENGGQGSGRIRLRTTCEADRVLVEVADNGPGIPKELQTRDFEPFYTTKGVGTGLGLDISYRIVVGRHGGDIRVISEPGDTRFQARLPLVANGGGAVAG